MWRRDISFSSVLPTLASSFVRWWRRRPQLLHPRCEETGWIDTNVELSSVHTHHVSLFSVLGLSVASFLQTDSFHSWPGGDVNAFLTLYVPGLGQVRYESHDHPHVHPCPHGDGEGGHEQSSSGAYSCTGEVSLGVGLACLSKQSREWSEAACYSSATSVRVGVKPHLREKARKCSPWAISYHSD